MPLGFVAMWRETDCEYRASKADEWGTTERIQAAFANGHERGIRGFGLYHCRWSSEWRYLTFWVCPDLTSLYDTIADLERAGDFKFADSVHFVGSLVENDSHLSPDVWDTAPEVSEDDLASLGVFLAWRHSDRAHLGSTALKLPGADGLRTFGQYECSYGSEWDQFSFWTAPDLRTVEEALRVLERSKLVGGIEAQVVLGNLELYYRFGSHLQTDFPWLSKEGN
jgi:hypothetical protein